MSSLLRDYKNDPVGFVKLCWPDALLYKKQRQILWSLVNNLETFVHAANTTGKSRSAALSALFFALTREPARVVIFSVNQKQLDNVIWREIEHLAATSKIPLPITVKARSIEIWQDESRSRDPMSYIIGHVTDQIEGIQGQHLPLRLPHETEDTPRVLVIFEEASGIRDEFYDKSCTFRHRTLVIGNPLNTTNFFYKHCKAGSRIDHSGVAKLHRNVVHISGEDSPNVIAGKQWVALNKKGAPPIILQGLLTYQEFIEREHEWDQFNKQTGLYGKFPDLSEMMMFRTDWLDNACKQAELLRVSSETLGDPTVMGIDTGQGRDETVWALANSTGLVKLIAAKTPDPTLTYHKTIDILREYPSIDSRFVAFDWGGGGLEVGSFMRAAGYMVTPIQFGASPSDAPTRSQQKKTANTATRQAYKNRRAEMYDMLRQRLRAGKMALLPADWPDMGMLREELDAIPLSYDNEGKMFIIPKGDKSTELGETKPTLRKILGRSPDRADAVVLCCFALSKLEASSYNTPLSSVAAVDTSELAGKLTQNLAQRMAEMQQAMAHVARR